MSSFKEIERIEKDKDALHREAEILRFRQHSLHLSVQRLPVLLFSCNDNCLSLFLSIAIIF